ncbi:translation elongation factor Ts [candidate division WWE3 bacterium RIFCSPLOWO2_01_FULL_42_11]|uniref:Elongation factor Ts n=1 Tax=candidate division WWE3 bacterium RIFCSPLOWO2_01_FULL_42_11 TaxID=1802627 RepID=A0A1F4VT11_UNCKA|nr:MAG: translation elongation factor Ts [candidate division WWE3 bacterium RIFCSPLOWO2_01_FULL_42_11]
MINLEEIKKLRDETGVSVIQCKKALEEADGDLAKAKEILAKIAAKLAQSKSDRDSSEGIIYSYIHTNHKIGVLLELSCETDFVARNEDFVKLAHELSMQIASTNPADLDELLPQDYIRDTSMKVQDLIQSTIGKLGENINVRRFTRYQVAE